MVDRTDHSIPCDRCGHENRPGANFCSACGNALPETTDQEASESEDLLALIEIEEEALTDSGAVDTDLSDIIEVVDEMPPQDDGRDLEDRIEIIDDAEDDVLDEVVETLEERGADKVEAQSVIPCPICEMDNPPGSVYCMLCGGVIAPDGVPCPDCDYVNPPGFLFCDGCGRRLGLE